MKPPVPEEYYQWLEQLQTVDFVLMELHLYLDTHPGDVQALQQYRAWNERRKAIAAEFEARFGPLTAGGNGRSAHHWEWVESPWPWQV
ncbi:spore coat protein CotJB [Kyrpidia spormannii]|uniref:Component of the inner spore coat n=2 Tax=Kyrpidia spormannii TaxID=2055160 RepID=A0ACA8Z895_9BACL|nr:spore coat protein CotJB [Kyrpidia spormannii]CAB3391597.1 component of the inner spore coat [Kyrpidia spormannii]CAB3392509.1 component of the inner spore coat [Kyrpidia spormannii]